MATDASAGITSGKYVRQIVVASSGPQGAQGPTGPTGPRGVTGPQGPAGTGGVAANEVANLVSYTHNQGVPSNTWSINHNLNFFPNATVFDSAGTQVEGNVTHTNETSLTITFSSAISGKAHLS
jgi:hypothetical protein